MTELTQDILRELVDYSPKTGVFTWRWRERHWFTSDRIWHSWNAKHAGKAAFTTIASDGYMNGRLLGRTYHVHRLAWFHVHGTWPAIDIDHRNRIRSDNRLDNLRLATRSQNKANAGVQRAGLKGVVLKNNGKWEARIKVAGRCIHLGMFETEHEAHAAYVRAAKAHFGEYARAA